MIYGLRLHVVGHKHNCVGSSKVDVATHQIQLLGLCEMKSLDLAGSISASEINREFIVCGFFAANSHLVGA